MNPFKKRSNASSQQTIILDTCALIDGRIVEIARAGFVPQSIVIPQFVIAELQFLADQGDSHKRERARFGLDVIRTLQDLRRSTVTIAREQFKDIKEVDDKLIALAKQYGAGSVLYTTDYNLNKVAQIEGVTVLNVNELAQALRPNWLPGERVEIKIIQVGQDNRQGVGYLDDGTMVVVEDGGRKIGQRLTVECKRMLQTQAGKMMFATLVSGPTSAPKQQKQPQAKPRAEAAVVAPKVQQAPSNNNKPKQAEKKPQRPVRNQQPKQGRFGRNKKASPEDSLLESIRRSEEG